MCRCVNRICLLCHNNEETITHLLYECQHVKPVWLLLGEILVKIIDKFDLNDVKIILFVSDVHSNNFNKNETLLINYVTTITKWLLWKHRNDFKYGNLPIKTISEKLTVIKKIICTEFDIFLKTRYVDKCDNNLLMLISKLRKLLTSDS